MQLGQVCMACLSTWKQSLLNQGMCGCPPRWVGGDGWAGMGGWGWVGGEGWVRGGVGTGRGAVVGVTELSLRPTQMATQQLPTGCSTTRLCMQFRMHFGSNGMHCRPCLVPAWLTEHWPGRDPAGPGRAAHRRREPHPSTSSAVGHASEVLLHSYFPYRHILAARLLGHAAPSQGIAHPGPAWRPPQVTCRPATGPCVDLGSLSNHDHDHDHSYAHVLCVLSRRTTGTLTMDVPKALVQCMCLGEAEQWPGKCDLQHDSAGGRSGPRLVILCCCAQPRSWLACRLETRACIYTIPRRWQPCHAGLIVHARTHI